jgi:hypothetical protein
MQKKPIIIIAVLSVLALGLGYWYGMPEEDSNERAEVSTPPTQTYTIQEREQFGISVGDELTFEFTDHYNPGGYQYIHLFSHADNSAEKNNHRIISMYDQGWHGWAKGKDKFHNAYGPFNTWTNITMETPPFYRSKGWHSARVLFLDNAMELYIDNKLIGVETNLPVQFNAAKNSLTNISLRSLMPGESANIKTEIKKIRLKKWNTGK